MGGRGCEAVRQNRLGEAEPAGDPVDRRPAERAGQGWPAQEFLARPGRPSLELRINLGASKDGPGLSWSEQSPPVRAVCVCVNSDVNSDWELRPRKGPLTTRSGH